MAHRLIQAARRPSFMGACLILFLVLAAPTTLFAQTDPWNAALDRFRQEIRTDVEADGIGAITAAVVVGDRMVWAEGFGWADRERGIPAGVETIYRIGSISKPVTAVALAQLADQGLVDLDAPVERYLPDVSRFVDPPDDAPPISFRHLATHTAGLIREPRLRGAAAGPIQEWEEKVLASIPTTSFDRAPGVAVSYSNIGFGVLGLVVSRVADRCFIQLVEQEIFEPLGMHSSTYIIGPDLEPFLATGYANRRDGSIDTERPALEHRGRGYKVPNGGVYSTVGDMARFMAGMTGAAGDAILRASMREEVMRIQTPGSTTSGYGLGFRIRVRSDGSREVGHGGSVSGYTAHMVFDPDTGIGVVLLRNYASGRTNLSGAATGLLRRLVSAWPMADPASTLADSAFTLTGSASALADSAFTLTGPASTLAESASALADPASTLAESASTLADRPPTSQVGHEWLVAGPLAGGVGMGGPGVLSGPFQQR